MYTECFDLGKELQETRITKHGLGFGGLTYLQNLCTIAKKHHIGKDVIYRMVVDDEKWQRIHCESNKNNRREN